MRSNIFFLVILCLSIDFIECTNLKVTKEKSPSTTLKPPSNKTEEKSPSTTLKPPSNETEETDSRTGLSFQTAGAQGTNDGSFSSAKHTSIAAAGVIRDSQGNINPLYSKAQGEGAGYSSGNNSPQTWANTRAEVRPGEWSGGSGSAGLSGGTGGASYSSYVNTVEMPLGDGSTLLSNLKTDDKSTKDEPTKSSEKEKEEEKEEKDEEKKNDKKKSKADKD